MKNNLGFGIIEIIVAMALFVTVAVTGIVTVIGSFSANRLGDEQTKATVFAQSGLEAVRSIKNQGWASPLLTTNCTVGCGLGLNGSSWSWSGTNNTLDKFTRVITVSDVQRDLTGTIVVSGGINDSDTKKVNSTVTWNFTPTRNNTVSLSTYLTNFRKAILALGGQLIYGDGTTIPKFRLYDSSANTFSSESSGVTSSSGFTFINRSSPIKTEAVAGYVTSAGVLNIMCFDGSSWSQEWTTTVGGNGTTRRFDIAYETNTGNVIVLYSNNVATTNELAYRIKSGGSGCGAANWTGATNLDPVRTSGTVQWVKMAWDRRSGSNLITAIWADSNSDLSAMVWNGSGWANEPSTALETSLEVVASAQDVEDFDVEYESLSGDVMIVWANSAGNNGANGVRYRTCTGGTANCTWSATITPPTFADDATNLDISANPNSDQIVFASIGNAGNDLQLGYWSGTAWTDTANADTSCNNPAAGTKLVSTGWLVSGATSRSIIRYADQGSSAIDWYTGNGGSFTKETDFVTSPSLNGPIYFDIQMNPLSKDQLMMLVSDGANDLFSKRLTMNATPTFTWTNSDGTTLETTLPQSINSPYSFIFWRY